MSLDLSACLRLPEDAPATARSCQDGLFERANPPLVCAAVRGIRGDALFPLRLSYPSGDLEPAGPAPPISLAGGEEQLVVKVFYLRQGGECDPATFDVDTKCSEGQSCLLSTSKAAVQVKAAAELQRFVWGTEELPCDFECGEPALCGAAGGDAALELCDGGDNDCDGAVDEGVLNACGECGPNPEEVCNGGDDDCDGQTDEGVLNVCGDCGPDPEEVCNGEDDDCDGQTDEGAPGDGEPCDTGVPGVCAAGIGDCTEGVFTCDQQVEASAEECDGLDNDCDGETDNGLTGPNGEDLHQPCIAGVGECERAGVSVCSEDGSGVECNAEPGEPAERDPCGDDRDNDCDGLVDEWEGGEEESRECVVGIGECQRRGRWECDVETGEYTACGVTPGDPRDEVCGNGLDEDCDGTPDQDCACDPAMEDLGHPGGTVPETQACYTGDPGTRDEGPCHAGTRTCQADGTWGAACEGEVLPVAEACNGADDDCDGAPDDGLEPPLANRQDGVCAGARQVCRGVPGWQEPDYGAIDGYQAAEAATCDGRDNDCDTLTDENVGEGPLADVQDGVCAGARRACGGGAGWVEPEYTAIDGYEAGEVSCDGRDNDCNGRTDEVCSPPSLDVWPADLEFGEVPVGRISDPQVVTLRNEGQLPANDLTLDLVGNDPGEFATQASGDGDCRVGMQVAAGDQCLIRVVFRPQRAGAFRAAVRAGGQAVPQVQATVTGEGTPPTAAGILAAGFPRIPANQGDARGIGCGNDVTIGPDGEVLVAGVASSLPGNSDLALWKFRPDGDVTAGYPKIVDGGVGGNDDGSGVAADRDGSIWVTGSVTRAGHVEFALWKFGANGDLVPGFPMTRSGERGGNPPHDRGYGVAVDDDGNVWAAGLSNNADAVPVMMLWKFDSQGNLLPNFPRPNSGCAGGNAGDQGRDVAIDGDGNIWVTGFSANAAGNMDFALWKFAPDGPDVFCRSRDGCAGGHGADGGNRVHVDAAGTVWVAGYSTNNNGNRDFALWKYDLLGNAAPGFAVFRDGIAGRNRASDEAHGVVVDVAGFVWVTGRGNGVNSNDFVLWKLDANGNSAIDPIRIDNAAGGRGSDVGRSLAVDEEGSVWVTGCSANAADSEALVLWKFE